MKIYLAGPISGQGYDAIMSHINTRKNALGKYDVIHPMTGKEHLRNEIDVKSSGYDSPVSGDHAIYGRDNWMVKQSDIIYADLMTSGDRVSIGTMMEIAWGSLLGKHIIVTMPKDNIHRHAFVLEAANIIFEDNESAINYLNDLIS